METGEHDEALTFFPIKTGAYGQDAATVLAQALMSAMRIEPNMNLWIDVQHPYIPAFVAQAIDICVAFDLRLVVTHAGVSSHPPGDPLASPLVESIARASSPRHVWHPVAKHLVPSIKHLARETL